MCLPVLADFAAGEKAFNDQDFATAWKELFPLAQKGDPRAMEAVGCMYLDGNGVEENLNEAMQWFTKAVDLGYLDAYNNIGFMYTEGLG
ncbi:MAG: SEL1-like repeat protein, partial [Candidatus Riflebacteria bacterium]|nr:SEL1-like repeat protein [Candidatus Riflebacteria bacterium]